MGGRAVLSVALLLPALTAAAFVAWNVWNHAQGQSGPGAVASRLPAEPAPDRLGDLRFLRESSAEKRLISVGKQSLISEGRVFTIRQGANVEGALQVAAFSPGVEATPDQLRDGVLRDLAPGHRDVRSVRGAEVYRAPAGENVWFLWFAPDGRYFDLMKASKQLVASERIFVSILETQEGNR